MKIMFRVTAEQLVDKFCDCGYIGEQGMKDLMDYLAANTQATHEQSDVLILEGIEPDELYEMRFALIQPDGQSQPLCDHPEFLQPKEDL